MKRNTTLLALAAVAAGLALPAFAEEGASFDPPHTTNRADDNAFHPAALAADDQQLADRVVDELRRDPAIKNTTVTVHVANGNVTLSGSPDNAATAARVREDAKRASGGAPVSSVIP